MTLAITVVSIWLHELGHALVARWQHDRLGGRRLTWKPLVNLDPILSLIVPLVTSLASGGLFAVGVGRPFLLTGPNVKISLAGVSVNALLAYWTWLTWHSYGVHEWWMLRIAAVNAVLAIFNLIPVKPLDGWAAWRAWKLTRRRVGAGAER